MEKIRGMENELRNNGKIAVVIIMTDGESTDGNVTDMLKPMVGLPVQIIIRMCTDEQEVSDYWRSIDATVDIDIRVLDDLEASGRIVAEKNSWLTYGLPLHRAREFGLRVPAFDALEKRLLSKTEIKIVAEILLSGPTPNAMASFPDPNNDWVGFLNAVKSANQRTPGVYCPLDKVVRPWINAEVLSRYQPDPLLAIMEQNEVMSSPDKLI